MPKRHRPGTSAASILRHVEDIVLATSGEDAFELVYAVAAARLVSKKQALGPAITEAGRRLELGRIADRALLARVDGILEGALTDESVLDAIFESLVPRVAKADKGQYFTPRHVVDFIVRMVAPRPGELLVDPACGSGAFLSRARAFGARTRGVDLDGRAVRVARLLAIAGGADAESVARADGLQKESDLVPADKRALADVVATNPPFAGRAAADGFSVADVVRTPERDVLFLERALDVLKPGGRLGIVLPYNKASGGAYASMRRWLFERARVLAVVGLPRETFLPHTSQRTFVLFAQKRRSAKEIAQADERTMFVISERAGKDTGGEPIHDATGKLDHDLDDVASELAPFLRAADFGREPKPRKAARLAEASP
ncbi:MAG: N-6 DNA methylase [Labilithrix sp.]|nr:N-6 DNA methylase [Labilithrix sp.]MCW5812306.1 N-6 DNA methylase [Labilithrix sp.]